MENTSGLLSPHTLASRRGRGRLAPPGRQNVPTVGTSMGRKREIECRADRRHEIDVADCLAAFGTCRHLAGPAHNERHTMAPFPGRAFGAAQIAVALVAHGRA